MFKRLSVCAGFATSLLLGSAAAAACLNETDMQRGIIVKFDNASNVAMRRTGQGLVEVTETSVQDNMTVRFTGQHGLYFTEEVTLLAARPEDNTRLEIIFDTTDAALPAPRAGHFWSGSTTNIFSDGIARPELYQVVFLEAEDTDVSGCSYETVHAIVEYSWPADDFKVSLMYAYHPALDTAYILSSSTAHASTPVNIVTAIEPATF